MPTAKFPSPLVGSQFSKGAWRLSTGRPGSQVSIPFGRVSVFKEMRAESDANGWRNLVVSIPFGRVSVFKACRIARLARNLKPRLMFPSPLGGSQFSKAAPLAPPGGVALGNISRFHPLWAGLSFQREGAMRNYIETCIKFPSPLGGSQFSKRYGRPGTSGEEDAEFPSPLGGSQFSKSTI